MADIFPSLHSYAKTFYSKMDFQNNTVASPLGSWMLLASIADTLNYENDADLKTAVENHLQMSTVEAEATFRELLLNPAIKYAAHSWTVPDLTSLPAVKQWIAENTSIPVTCSIPSQVQLDDWVSSNSNNLIEKFPMQVGDETLLIIANVIYSKMTWVTKFNSTPASNAMSDWNVKNVLNATATDNVSFYRNVQDQIFAIYEVEANSKNNESVFLITCLSNELEPAQLLSVMDELDDMELLDADDDMLVSLTETMYKVKEVRQGTSSFEVEVNLPAWEVQSEHNLMQNSELGYQSLLEALSKGATEALSSEAKQIAVARFDKEGFEAAAVTSIRMTRCFMPMYCKQTVYELNFTKPFAFVSYADSVPMFSGYICTAKEN